MTDDEAQRHEGRDNLKLLEVAFPRRQDDHTPFCCWCGKNRSASDALCRGCWYSIAKPLRSMYYTMNIMDRARWLLANAPGAF